MGCASDQWDDKHKLMAFESQRSDIYFKRLECQQGIIELWEKMNKKSADDKQHEIVKQYCKKQIVMPKAPAECRDRDEE
jgi:hypothetical protein